MDWAGRFGEPLGEFDALLSEAEPEVPLFELEAVPVPIEGGAVPELTILGAVPVPIALGVVTLLMGYGAVPEPIILGAAPVPVGAVPLLMG